MSLRLVVLVTGLILAWAVALNSGRDLAFNLAYLLTGILALSYGWAWSSIRFLSLRRITRARRSQVGLFFEESFEVRNLGRLPKLWLEVQDHSTLPFHQVSRVVSNLGGKSRHRWQVRTLCQQRGVFRLGPLTLRSGDPLGLFLVEKHLPPINHLVVYPMTVPLRTFQPPIADLAGGEALRRRTHYLTTNVAGIREYAPGDSFNRIHWLSTARTGRLMTKEFELDPTADVWIFLDLNQYVAVELPWQPTRPEQGLFALLDRPNGKRPSVELPPSTTEYAVAVAASVARYFLLKGRAVGLISHGHRRQLLQTDRGERQLTKILELLARVQADGYVPFAQLLVTDGVRLNRNDTILAVSPDPRPDWARSLREMRRRGVQSIAVSIDGASFGSPLQPTGLLHELELAGIPTYKVSRGQRIQDALGRPAVGVVPS